MPDTSPLKFGRTETGYRLCVAGRGTMRESKPAELFVVQALNQPDVAVVIDLADCQYLDSTFLGCLLGLSTQHGPGRFRVVAPPDVARKLFGPTKLDVVLKIGPDAPAIVGDYTTLPAESIDAKEISRHIMECHRRLAEIPCPQQKAFAAIAQQMAKELEARG